ncbi:hypothetical protein CNMCM6106_006746 [Aspergillus hiratsukae]|uniref:Uncharacterized protein n=1 Tax=Aspergillus hiratsukae TaxID=1194566 RepID=A0A8H6QIK7_9EURO|nr:hypothetical protein CNMCM6106_006746 [Aspergillus hiratsukae]
MESSNRQFLQDRIDEIEAMNLPSEEEKLKRMCAYWPGFGDKSEDPWKDRDSVGPVRQHREQRSVTRLADVKTLYHMYMDGTLPPTLLTDEWRQMYLETLQSVCNEAAIRDEGDEDFEIPLCHELGSFIKYADGVHDPDFHRSGIAPFEPTLSIGIVNYTIKDSLAIYELPISRVREELKCSLQESLCGENFIDGVVDEDLK